MSVSDEFLVKKVQSGELQAFATLVERYQDWVYNLALKMLGVPEDAKDATQEVFVRVYRALPGFRGDAKFSTWLYRLASNRCLDMARVRNREKGRNISFDGGGILAERLADAGAGPEEIAVNRDTMERVRLAIGELPENYRLALVLHHYQGLSYREVANVLGMPPSTVATHINRAKKKLREKLVGGDGSDMPEGKGKLSKLFGRRMSAL